MVRFCKKLIRRLRPVKPAAATDAKEDFCLFRSDWYKKEHVNTSIYVPYKKYDNSAIEDIERELVRLLGDELLNRGLLYFNTSVIPDKHGDIQVGCQMTVLEAKDRTGLMPSRLDIKYLKGDESMDEQN